MDERKMNRLYDKVILNDDPMGLIYMWVKQHFITKKEFQLLVERYYNSLASDIVKEQNYQKQLDMPS